MAKGLPDAIKTLQESVDKLRTSQVQESDRRAMALPNTPLVSTLPESPLASPLPKELSASPALMPFGGVQLSSGHNSPKTTSGLSSKSSSCVKADDGKVRSITLFKDNL